MLIGPVDKYKVPVHNEVLSMLNDISPASDFMIERIKAVR